MFEIFQPKILVTEVRQITGIQSTDNEEPHKNTSYVNHKESPRIKSAGDVFATEWRPIPVFYQYNQS